MLIAGAACSGIGFLVQGNNDPVFYVLSTEVRPYNYLMRIPLLYVNVFVLVPLCVAAWIHRYLASSAVGQPNVVHV